MKGISALARLGSPLGSPLAVMESLEVSIKVRNLWERKEP
jgi:hypothetical protein